MRGKWKSLAISERGDAHYSGTGDSGNFEIAVTGKRVEIREGL